MCIALITTGGTGFFIRDSMPEAVSVLFDKSIDGFGEMFHLLSKDDIGMSAIQSRAIAGMANGTGISACGIRPVPVPAGMIS